LQESAQRQKSAQAGKNKRVADATGKRGEPRSKVRRKITQLLV